MMQNRGASYPHRCAYKVTDASYNGFYRKIDRLIIWQNNSEIFKKKKNGHKHWKLNKLDAVDKNQKVKSYTRRIREEKT